MAKTEETAFFCQNTQCRHKFNVFEITWPPRAWSLAEINTKKVCPKCGFKTGSRFDTLGIGEIMNQAVIDYPEFLTLKLP